MKKYTAVLTSALLVLCVMTGCNSNASAQESQVPVSTATTAETAENTPDAPPEIQKEKGTLAKVTAIDGSNVTFAVSTKQMDRGQKPENETNNGMSAPSQKDDSQTPPDEQNRPENGTDQAPPQNQDGQAPSDGMQKNEHQQDMFENSETITLTIDDTLPVYIEENMEQTQGSIADLAVNNMVRISYDETGETPVSITVTKMNAPAQSADAPVQTETQQ